MTEKSMKGNQWFLYILFLLTLIFLTSLAMLQFGSSTLSWDRILATLSGAGNQKDQFILFNLRLPRIFTTLLTGMALALSGAVLQTVSRNDLADPGLLGINSGAGVGVTFLYLFYP